MGARARIAKLQLEERRESGREEGGKEREIERDTQRERKRECARTVQNNDTAIHGASQRCGSKRAHGSDLDRRGVLDLRLVLQHRSNDDISAPCNNHNYYH